jgi:acyl-CoA synthetase (AMP-forming)/AMP-acid ligase II
MLEQSGIKWLAYLLSIPYALALPKQSTQEDAKCRADENLQVDSMTLAYAVHRLNGVATPANAAYSASELEFQLKSSGAKALFTVSLSYKCGW